MGIMADSRYLNGSSQIKMHVTHFKGKHLEICKLIWGMGRLYDVVMGWVSDPLGDFLSHYVEILGRGDLFIY
jgi:hypothetical protein